MMFQKMLVSLLVVFLMASSTGCAWLHRNLSPNPRRAIVLASEFNTSLVDHPTPAPTFRFLWGYRRDGWIYAIGGRGTGRILTAFGNRPVRYGLESGMWEASVCRVWGMASACGIAAMGSANTFREGDSGILFTPGSNTGVAFRVRAGLRMPVWRLREQGVVVGTVHIEAGGEASLYVTRWALATEDGVILWTQGPVGIAPFVGIAIDGSD